MGRRSFRIQDWKKADFCFGLPFFAFVVISKVPLILKILVIVTDRVRQSLARRRKSTHGILFAMERGMNLDTQKTPQADTGLPIRPSPSASGKGSDAGFGVNGDSLPPR